MAKIWFTIYDGSQWQIPDSQVTRNGKTKTNENPSIAKYQDGLYLAYRGTGTTNLYYNVFDGTSWLDNDIKITKNGKTKSNAGPSLAVYSNHLFMAYKGSGSTDLYYNVFDGNSWLDNDIKITKNGKTKSNATPSLAVYNGLLFMAYKGSRSTDLYYNVYDGNNWLDNDIKITRNGKTKSSAAPFLAVFNGLLFMAYKGSSSTDLYYNVYDGTSWLDSDIKITKNGKTKSNAGPALAVYDNRLYMAYKGSDSNNLYYNVFDGGNWLDSDIQITQNGKVKTLRTPALSEFNGLLFMIYRDGNSSSILGSIAGAIGGLLNGLAGLVDLIFVIPILGRFLKWVWNFVLDIFWRLIGILAFLLDFTLSLLGIILPKKLRICCIVLKKNETDYTTTTGDLTYNLQQLAETYKQARVNIIPSDFSEIHFRRRVDKDLLLVACNARGFILDSSHFGSKFQLLADWVCFDGNLRRLIGYGAPIVVFVVQDFTDDKNGCGLYFTDYVTVKGSKLGPTANDHYLIAHECGHACGFKHERFYFFDDWPKSNLMYSGSGRGNHLTRFQIAFLRNSKHVTFF